MTGGGGWVAGALGEGCEGGGDEEDVWCRGEGCCMLFTRPSLLAEYTLRSVKSVFVRDCVKGERREERWDMGRCRRGSGGGGEKGKGD